MPTSLAGQETERIMSSLIRSKIFCVRFTFGILTCFFLNYYSYPQNRGTANIFDCGWKFGFPFPLYMEGGFVSWQQVIWLGLISDILIAVTASLLVGLLFLLVKSRMMKQQF
jgi:hypothetical protein